MLTCNKLKNAKIRDLVSITKKEVIVFRQSSPFWRIILISVLNLVDGLTNFCVPGTDSISSSMSFALLYIASTPNVQKKIHAEIDAVIGRQRLPDPADRPK